jgi:hypothetical protein
MIELPIAYSANINEDEVLLETKYFIENKMLLFDINNLNQISDIALKDVAGYVLDIKNNMAKLKFINQYEKYENEFLKDFYILLYFGRYNKYEKATLININNLNEKLRRNLKIKEILKSIN